MAQKIDLGKVVGDSGKQGYVFNTLAEVNRWIAGEDVREDGRMVSELKAGDNIWIIDEGTPDYWWDGSNLQKLEVDSIGLATATDAGLMTPANFTKLTGIASNAAALGETSTTAYRGDRGKTAYDHSQLTSGTNPHATTFANIASKPTTLSGYGITDAVPSARTISLTDSDGTNTGTSGATLASNVTLKLPSAIKATITGNATSATTAVTCTGNAATATKLATARTVGLSGVTATAQSFDGSGNITIPVTAVPATLLTGTASISTTGSSGSCTGNAATATKLATARTVSMSGVTATAQSFDGSGNITIPVTAVPATLLTGTLNTAVLPSFKTINGESLVGSGNITVNASSAATLYRHRVMMQGSAGTNMFMLALIDVYTYSNTAITTIATLAAALGISTTTAHLVPVSGCAENGTNHTVLTTEAWIGTTSGSLHGMYFGYSSPTGIINRATATITSISDVVSTVT